jgi:hypothetical protein
VIFRHTGGVPRQINTLCSRLLLYGFLEELHTLQAAIVEKVANDLRQEMAVVTLDQRSEAPHHEPNGRAEAMTEVTKRLSALEENINRHGRVIKRAIEIAAAYFQVERP